MGLNWGIYGLGGHMMQRLLPAIREAKGCHVAAAGHYKPETAKEICREVGIKKACGSMGELLAIDEVEAVAVATPNYLHFEHAIAVLESGKHLLVEKPMTLKVGDAEKLVEAASSKGLTLGVGFHLRHHPILVEMQRLLQNGEIGEPLYLQVSFGRAHHWPTAGWWSDPRLAGPQVLMGYGVHALDLCRWMLNAEFKRIYASMMWEPANTFTVVHVDMNTSARCSIMCSTAINHIPNTIEVMGRDARLIGAGAVTTTDAGKLLRSTGKKVDMIDVTPRNPYVIEIEEFCEAVSEGKTFHADGIDGLKVVMAQAAADESAKTGKAVSVHGEG